MFRHLIVPLDGSRLAEGVLPSVIHLAQKLQAEVTLVHVVEQNAPKEVHGEPHLSDPEEAAAYLKEVVRRMFPPNLRVHEHVHATAITDVAAAIVDHAKEFESDLVVMCTHGRGGLRKLLFGNIAQKVVGSGVAPVLLIRPTEEGTAPFLSGRPLLVPLDGTEVREQALPIATALASACGVGLKLVIVIPTLGTLSGVETASRVLLPGTTNEMLALAEEDAAVYLHRHTASLQAEGVAATAEIFRGDPTDAIVTVAHKLGVDMIVMGTLGKTGMDAFWSSSVAPKVSRRTHLPLLLVPYNRQTTGGKPATDTMGKKNR